MKTVLTMDERDASALAWERFVSFFQRHPWRVRVLILSVAAPIFALEWFVLGWKVVALIYAVATVGLLFTIGGVIARHTRPIPAKSSDRRP